MPPTHIFASALDPLLDDSVQFARRLFNLGKSVHLQVYYSVSHGFLNFKGRATDADQAFAHSHDALRRTMREDRIFAERMRLAETIRLTRAEVDILPEDVAEVDSEERPMVERSESTLLDVLAKVDDIQIDTAISESPSDDQPLNSP